MLSSFGVYLDVCGHGLCFGSGGLGLAKVELCLRHRRYGRVSVETEQGDSRRLTDGVHFREIGLDQSCRLVRTEVDRT